MENQEPWEPTFPAGYTLSPNAAYEGGMSSRPTHGPNHTARWPPSETSATPTVTATAPVVPTKAEPASCSGGRGVGANPGRGGEGPGGGSTGEEEQPNAIAYNTAYVEGRWGLFRHAGAMRLVTRKASLAGVDIPSSLVDPNCKACPAFHIKGMCNTGCGNVTDHVCVVVGYRVG